MFLGGSCSTDDRFQAKRSDQAEYRRSKMVPIGSREEHYSLRGRAR